MPSFPSYFLDAVFMADCNSPAERCDDLRELVALLGVFRVARFFSFDDFRLEHHAIVSRLLVLSGHILERFPGQSDFELREVRTPWIFPAAVRG